jgi:hypothetical protein
MRVEKLAITSKNQVMTAAMADAAIGTGAYTLSEAARLSGLNSDRIRRWVDGYRFSTETGKSHSKPVWQRQYSRVENRIVLGFHDLIELRYIEAFLRVGITLQALRRYHEMAAERLQTPHPFCTDRCRTDGRKILLDRGSNEPDLYELQLRARDQRVFSGIIEPFLKQLDFDDEGMAMQWWPLGRERCVFLNPAKQFGQPLANSLRGALIPTAVLGRFFSNYKDAQKVADLYEIDKQAVIDAVEFEGQFKTAA